MAPLGKDRLDATPGMSLALRVDGQRVFVMLTDFEALACHGWAPGTLDSLHRAIVDGTSARALFSLVFPPEVANGLSSSTALSLTVQLPFELDPLPIEALDNGSGPLTTRFALVRQLEGPTKHSAKSPNALVASERQTMTVLLVTDPDSPAASAGVVTPAFDLRCASAAHTIAAIANDATSFAFGADIVLLCCAEPTRVAVECASKAPALWCWPATGTDLDTIVALRRSGHAVLLAPQGLPRSALRLELEPWLQACAAGITPAAALRDCRAADCCERTPSALEAAPVAGWRLYHTTPHALRSRDEPAVAVQPNFAPEVADDHRQVTALSFDLVDSTALIARLGDENYSDMLVSMHALCGRCVTMLGGAVSDRKDDDGSMAYFGVPRAFEDAAARALDAALAMHAAVQALPSRPQLRIGLATGPVVVRGGLPYGRPLHLAARLRQRAMPGSVVTDEATRRLANQRFEFVSMLRGEPLKGIAEDVASYQLVGPRTALPTTAAPSTRFVGREAELADLQHRWKQASAGRVVAVLVRGEAGVGKSRLVREFIGSLRADGQRFIEMRGLPETQGGAFRTLADALRKKLGLRHDDSDETQRAAMARWVPQATADPSALQPLWRLLGVDARREPRSSQVGAGDVNRERANLIAGLADVVADAALDAPMALIVEDLPSVDPSSLEWLQRVIDSPRPARLLVLCTQRGDETAVPLLRAETLHLGRLSSVAARWLIREAGGDALPPDLVQRLAERGDGVPLFLEESARMAVEAGGRPGPWLAEVPSSLQGLLMARLDQLGALGKKLSQMAAVLGRDFPIALFEATAASPSLPEQFRHPEVLLHRLVQAGVLRAYEAAGASRVAFRHELVRDVAYGSLWQRDRVALHAAVAEALRERFSHDVEAHPESLAHHLAGCDRHAEAVTLLEKAARSAAAASANRESIGHLRAALASLERAEPSGSRGAIELRLLLMLASRLIAAEGYGAEEVARVYERAEMLALAHGDSAARGKVLLGLESVYVMRGELGRAETLARQALSSALVSTEPLPILQARWALAHVRFHRGDSLDAVRLMDECLAAYAPLMHHRGAVQDPGVMCLCYSAWALWELGMTDTALRRVDEVVALARAREHAFSLGEAYGFAASVSLFRGEVEAGLRWADLAVEVCDQAGFIAWLAHAHIVRGRLRALGGHHASGRDEMDEAFRQWTATGAVITRPFYLSLIAETMLEAGDVDGAARRVGEASALVERTGERYHEAEVMRLVARTALARGEFRHGEALLRQALATATAQHKHSFVLRAAIDLGEHLVREGRHHDAFAVVSEPMALIAEGAGTRDVRRARTLLATCNGEATSSSAKPVTPAVN